MNLILSQPTGSGTFDEATAQIQRELDGSGANLEADDILVLPEGIWTGSETAPYEQAVGEWASSLGCHVVGGSYLHRAGAGFQNRGVVVDSEGRVVARYAKRCAYGGRSVPAAAPWLAEFEVGGFRVAALLCADLWFSDLILGSRSLSELIVVPACSVSRKPSPQYSRTMWRHMAVSRAYEFGAFVGISDWSCDAELGAVRASAVAGLADPTQVEPHLLFNGLGMRRLCQYELDLERLLRFREDRESRQFFWGPETRVIDPPGSA